MFFIFEKKNMREIIEKAWENRELLSQPEVQSAIRTIIDNLDKGKLRIAEPKNEEWIVNEWIKKAVILYFPIQKMELIEVSPFTFYDKIPLKNNFKELGVRVVPHGLARYGSYLAKGVILMPSYVNIEFVKIKIKPNDHLRQFFFSF